MYSALPFKQPSLFGNNWIYQMILDRIPKDHPLLKLKPVIDEVIIESEHKIKRYYSCQNGRPAYPVSVILKMHLLEYLYNLSDVAISKICVHDFLFKWFIDLDITEAVPDDTTLVRFRERLKDEGFQEIFDSLVKITNRFGYKKGKLRICDATHVFSDTPILGKIALIKQGIRKILHVVKKIDKKIGEKLQEKYNELIKKVYKKKESVRKLSRKAKEFVENVRMELKKKAKGIEKLLSTLTKVANGNKDKIVSFSDLDARWGRKSKNFVFGGYKVHTACDQKGFITSVEVLPGNKIEGNELKSLVENELKRGLKIDELHGDAIYDSAENRMYLKRRNIKAYIPSRMPKSKIEEFEIIGYRVKCPMGKYSIGSIRQENGSLFYFSTYDCKNCKEKWRCLSKSETRKRVFLSDCKSIRLENIKEKWKVRKVAERIYGWAKRWHGLSRARYRGIWRVKIQAIMTFLLINMKIMVARAP